MALRLPELDPGRTPSYAAACESCRAVAAGPATCSRIRRAGSGRDALDERPVLRRLKRRRETVSCGPYSVDCSDHSGTLVTSSCPLGDNPGIGQTFHSKPNQAYRAFQFSLSRASGVSSDPAGRGLPVVTRCDADPPVRQWAVQSLRQRKPSAHAAVGVQTAKRQSVGQLARRVRMLPCP
jgi:hypothetical protein